jgi:2-octaprenyl-3-methyl-6-methoxy-1,4-benzoquinol hydroxylase
MENRQVIVVGGGLVGALTALLLAQKGEYIHLIENKDLISPLENSPFDLRVSAFSAQSKKLLELAGVWDLLPKNRLCAYQRLQTWEKGSEKLCFDSTEIGLDALGYIAENRWIQAVLWQSLKSCANVCFYEGREVRTLHNSDSGVSVYLDNNQRIDAQLLIACDGAKSAVRGLLNIAITAWDYRQHCMLINIKTDAPEQNITWQEFRESGPCAFLPLAGNNASLVWYHHPQKIKYLNSLSKVQLKKAIIEEFPVLPFAFSVQDNGSFPLTRRHAQRYYKGSCVLLGDAAHTIHPLAGQGVNLGFKDVQCLVELLENSADLPIPVLLKRYEAKRKPANLLMQTTMDLFYKGSKCELDSLRLLRKGILHLAQNSGALKKQVMRYAMGL